MPKHLARLFFRNRATRRARPRRGWWPGALAVLGGTLVMSVAMAQNAPRAEQLIKWRQSAYQAFAWNSTRLKTAISAGTYDAVEVRAAANTLAALAASGLPSLFVTGTDKGKGWRDTTARDTVFSDPAGFRELSDDFARETALLAKLAATADAQAVQAQFLKVAQGCKGCHNKFRQTE